MSEKHHLRKAGWLLTAGAVAGIAIGFLFRRRIAARLDRRPGGSKTVETAFGTVEYAVAGAGEPVLVVHGASGGFDQGLHVAAPLADKGCYLIAPSRFGYLGSGVPENPTPAAQADAFAKLLDRLGIRHTVVLAVSAGAWSALQFAVRHPARCRALVLMVPATTLPPGVRMYGGLMARTLYRSNLLGWMIVRLAAAFPKLAAVLLATPAAILEAASGKEKRRIRQMLDDILPVRAHAEGMTLDLAAAQAGDALPVKKIGCPVLAISAEDDAFQTAARAREIAQTAPKGTAIVYPTGGHLLVGRQETVIDEVVSFLARLN
ncbi:MAG TPA: alpha/beta hydrolase [Rhizomicrobium sp.]|nr:alpha/beta hydrolase [Rhizomicrobium sp.]